MEKDIKIMDKIETIDKIIVEKEPPIVGCINKNVCSSTLFIIPSIYAFLTLPLYSNVMFGSIMCLITSVMNHYYKTKNKFYRKIDLFTVIPIGAYFTLHSLFNIGFKFYANIMYILTASALGIYFYLLNKPNLYCDYHCLIHIIANTGIMFYIKALKTYIYTPSDDTCTTIM